MEKLKKYTRITLIWLAVILIYVLLLSVLNYTQILKYKTVIKMNFIVVAIVTFVFGILTGKTSTKKGYLEGIKLGSLVSTILFILNLILYRTFSLSILLYYLVIITSSTVGSMIGINLKK